MATIIVPAANGRARAPRSAPAAPGHGLEQARPVPEARYHSGAWVGIGLLTATLVLRATLYGLIDPAAKRPAYFLVGYPVILALFPHGQVGAAIFVAQGTALAAGLVAAAQTRAFTDLDDSTRRGALALEIAGLATVVPIVVAAVITAIPAAGALLIAVFVVSALRGFH